MLPSSRIEISHQKQADGTAKLLQKHVDRWSDDCITHSKEEKKLSHKTRKPKSKKDILAMITGEADTDTPSTLAHPPGYLRQFSEFVCASVTAPINCTGIYYGSLDSIGKELDKPSDDWALLAFSHLIQSYLTCCGSISESNVSECHQQYKVCESFTDWHSRYQLLLKAVPIDSIAKLDDSAKAIRKSKQESPNDANKLGHLVGSLKGVSSIRDLLAAVRVSAAKATICGTTEQAHILKKKLQESRWSDSFAEGTTHIRSNFQQHFVFIALSF